jgi:Domain of unknown function (4846)
MAAIRIGPCTRFVVVAILSGLLAAPSYATGLYPWRVGESRPETISGRLPPPPGFERVAVPADSFAAWLRGLPLKPNGTAVKLFNGTDKPRQDVHAAVIDIDAGSRDLQQCADAVMRLRAEWLFAADKKSEIGFNFTSGARVPFSRYAKGERPDESGKTWKASAKPDASYPSFRKYMNLVFSYAGTASLEKELAPVATADLQIGDVFIKGGFPGHAVIVADVAENKLTKAKRFLLIQSYMPAQDMHVLKNPANGDGSPWYALPTAELITPEWTFAAGSLRRWP